MSSNLQKKIRLDDHAFPYSTSLPITPEIFSRIFGFSYGTHDQELVYKSDTIPKYNSREGSFFLKMKPGELEVRADNPDIPKWFAIRYGIHWELGTTNEDNRTSLDDGTTAVLRVMEEEWAKVGYALNKSTNDQKH